jgi:glycosyltransferase involved in cell wall biosynthesis
MRDGENRAQLAAAAVTAGVRQEVVVRGNSFDHSVSVVIPVHNGRLFIAEALSSVRAQTHQPGEVIVVDDGSIDGTDAIVAGFEGVALLRQSRAGAGAARNAGVARATGEFLAFLDADDIWPATRLECQVAMLTKKSELDFVSGRMVQFRRNEAGAIELLSEPAASRLPSALLLRREAFWRVGVFSTHWDVGETIEWWSRAVDVGLRGQAIADNVLLRRRHSDNLGRTVNAPQRGYLNMLHAVITRRRTLGNA